MNAIVKHTTYELRRGLHCALGATITEEFRTVEDELRLAGFVTDLVTVTPAGRRFLGITGGSTQSPRAAA